MWSNAKPRYSFVMPDVPSMLFAGNDLASSVFSQRKTLDARSTRCARRLA